MADTATETKPTYVVQVDDAVTEIDVSNSTEAKSVAKVIRTQNPGAKVKLLRTAEVDIDAKRAPRNSANGKSASK